MQFAVLIIDNADISYTGRARLIDQTMSSLSFLLVRPAKRTRHENRD